jgi:hypothetical protein
MDFHLVSCRDVAAAGARLFVSSAAADAQAAKEGKAASTDLIESLVCTIMRGDQHARLIHHENWCKPELLGGAI